MRTINGKSSWFPKKVFRTILNCLIIVHIPNNNQGCLWAYFIRHYYTSGFINVEKSCESRQKNSIIVNGYLISYRIAASGYKCNSICKTTCVYTQQTCCCSNTNTKNSTSTSNTKWQYTLRAYHKYLTKSGAKNYINIGSLNLIAP